jgi:DNA-binding NarL/FixJ family response regulator
MSISLVIIDDHPLVNLGISKFLESRSDMTLAAHFATMASAREWIAGGGRADVAILDRTLNEDDGLALVPDLHRHGIKVVMLTMADSDQDISDAVAAGVEGYVVKSSDPEQVLAAARAAMDGQGSFPAHVLERIARGEIGVTGYAQLTPREQEIVHHVAQGMSNKVIAARLNLSENTVRNHLRNIMEKLNLRNRVQVAALVLKPGKGRG